MAVPLCPFVCAVTVQHSFVSMGRVPVASIFTTELAVLVFLATFQRFIMSQRYDEVG
jgi:hypothetical protein